jgi:acetamidase/formamidase
VSVPGQSVRPRRHDAVLRSTPDTVIWGHIAADREPVLRIRPGQTVRIDTVSHQGLTAGRDPVEVFGSGGIAAGEVLPEARDIYRTVKRAEGAGAHIITGPIHVEGARPGDLLEVRVLDVEFRVPYGINATGPGRGAAPELLSQAAQKIIRLDLARNVALFSREVEVPLAPFMGIVAVAPPPETPRVSTRPPGAFGGNLDFKHLTAGSTLYLPVFNEGALFYTGDGHGVQGDGEVDGTAIEVSLTPTLQFMLRKEGGKAVKWPRAEDAHHYYVMGMAADLDTALRNAVSETAGFLQLRAGLTDAEAYALCSLAVDFRIGEAVNSVVMVYGMIPKKLIRDNTGYWA